MQQSGTVSFEFCVGFVWPFPPQPFCLVSWGFSLLLRRPLSVGHLRCFQFC